MAGLDPRVKARGQAPAIQVSAVSNGWPMILSGLKTLLETGQSFEASRHWPKGM